jgi:hypothetical protein
MLRRVLVCIQAADLGKASLSAAIIAMVMMMHAACCIVVKHEECKPHNTREVIGEGLLMYHINCLMTRSRTKLLLTEAIVVLPLVDKMAAQE